jgi:hypothetical protein
VALGIALNCAGWIAAWYRGASGRAVAPADVWSRHGRRLAFAGLLMLLGAAAVLLGASRRTANVNVAWMTLGSAFVPCVNASRARVLTSAAVLGTAGGLLLLIGIAGR